MTAAQLEQSALSGDSMPAGLSTAHQALWMARAGKWDAAHDLCQNVPGNAGFWIHAHLHRQEGDHPNAAYWYSRSEQPIPPRDLTIADEWSQLVEAL